MKCKDKADLHQEYARVLRMCGGDEDLTASCVRFGSGAASACSLQPKFHGNPADYEFARALIQRKPAFVGDDLYLRGVPCRITTDILFPDSAVWSWNPPSPNAEWKARWDAGEQLQFKLRRGKAWFALVDVYNSEIWNNPNFEFQTKPRTIIINGIKLPAPLQGGDIIGLVHGLTVGRKLHYFRNAADYDAVAAAINKALEGQQ